MKPSSPVEEVKPIYTDLVYFGYDGEQNELDFKAELKHQFPEAGVQRRL
jgi:hypothetical protein